MSRRRDAEPDRQRRLDDDTTVLNPAAAAESIRSTPLGVDDDRLDPNDTLKEFPDSAERARALDLGAAGQQAVLDQGLQEVTPERAAAAALEAELLADDVVWTNTEDRYKHVDRHRQSMDSVPNSTIAVKRAMFSLYGKFGFLAGDTAVIAAPQWRAGTPVWLAMLTGVSTGLAMVFIGSMYGKNRTESDQRETRGPRPANCPQGEVDLYGDPVDADSERDAASGITAMRADSLWRCWARSRPRWCASPSRPTEPPSANPPGWPFSQGCWQR